MMPTSTDHYLKMRGALKALVVGYLAWKHLETEPMMDNWDRLKEMTHSMNLFSAETNINLDFYHYFNSEPSEKACDECSLGKLEVIYYLK